ncbi:hypothetical protein D3C81_1795210 [compost metagenome]
MILRRQIHRGHEVIRQLFPWMCVQPLLRDRHELLVEAKTTLTVIFESEIGFDPGRGSNHRSCAAGWRLGNDRDVADPFGANRFANFRIHFRHHFHKSALQIFVRFESREGTFLFRDICGGQVSFLGDKAI